jgi:hypothetical protein
VEAEQAADAVEREAEPELDGLELGADDDEQREAARAARQPRVQQADGLERNLLLELKLEDARVARLRAVVGEEAAALEPAAADGEPDAGRRLEADREVGLAEVAAAFGEGQRGGEPHPLDDRGERPELEARRPRKLRHDAVAVGAHADRDGLDRERPERDVERQLRFEPRAAAEVEAVVVRPAGGQLEARAQPVVRENLFEEAVAVAGRDDERGLDHLGQHAEVLLGRREVRLGRDAQALGLEARPRRAAETRDGRAGLGQALDFDARREPVGVARRVEEQADAVGADGEGVHAGRHAGAQTPLLEPLFERDAAEGRDDESEVAALGRRERKRRADLRGRLGFEPEGERAGREVLGVAEVDAVLRLDAVGGVGPEHRQQVREAREELVGRALRVGPGLQAAGADVLCAQHVAGRFEQVDDAAEVKSGARVRDADEFPGGVEDGRGERFEVGRLDDREQHGEVVEDGRLRLQMRNRHRADEVAPELLELRRLRALFEDGGDGADGGEGGVGRVERLAQLGERLRRLVEKFGERLEARHELVEPGLQLAHGQPRDLVQVPADRGRHVAQHVLALGHHAQRREEHGEPGQQSFLCVAAHDPSCGFFGFGNCGSRWSSETV